MAWLKWMLIGLAAVLVLVFGMLALLGMFSGGGKEARRLSTTVGQHTITISYHKAMTQESIGDGVKIVADGHTIFAAPDSIVVNGETISADPTQDVVIDIDEAGKLTVGGVAIAPASPQQIGPEEGAAPEAAPPEPEQMNPEGEAAPEEVPPESEEVGPEQDPNAEASPPE